MEDTVFQRIALGARLTVTGDDASAFLQGQFSNELRRSEPCPVTYGLWLNHKGRALADSMILQRGAAHFEIVSRTSSAVEIRERLETYIIADDVVVDDLTVACGGVLVAGPGASDAVAALGLPVPSPREFSVKASVVVLPGRIDVRPSWLVIAPTGELPGLIAGLQSAGAREARADELERLRVSSGIPAVPQELGPDDLPNEGGLDHDAISYTKGCYLGQEVMARLHNLGQVRRRLMTVRMDPGAALAVGAALFLGEQKVGELRSVVPLVDGASVGLAMVTTHLVRGGAKLSGTAGAAAMVHVERLVEGRAP